MNRTILSASFLLALSSSHAQWEQLGNTANSIINVMEVFDSKLYFGGNFTQFNGTSTYGSMSYNGTSFSYHGTLLGGTGFMCLAEHEGTLFGGGGITAGFGGPNGVAFWNGGTWEGSAYNVNNTVNVNALTSFGGDLIVGGAFTDPLPRVARHNGTSYQAMGAGFDGTANDFAIYNGELYACGSMTASGTTPLNRVAKWTGTAWVDVGGGCDDFVREIEVYNGQLYAIGSFLNAGGSPASHVARWNGTSWSSVGAGITYSLGGGVSGLHASTAGLLVGGKFTNASGVPVANVALWNGTAWSDPGGVALEENVIDFETYQGQVYMVTYVGGVGAYAKVYRSGAVGFEELATMGNGLILAPNPTQDRISVSGGDIIGKQYRIIDAAGRVCLAGRVEATIDVQQLEPGTYRFSLVGGNSALPFVKY